MTWIKLNKDHMIRGDQISEIRRYMKPQDSRQITNASYVIEMTLKYTGERISKVFESESERDTIFNQIQRVRKELPL